MRGLAGLSLLGLLITVAIMFYMTGEGTSGKDNGVSIGLGFGKVPSGAYEMHVRIEFAMTRTEGPEMSKNNNPMWEEWIDEHFKLVDANGAAIALHQIGREHVS